MIVIEDLTLSRKVGTGKFLASILFLLFTSTATVAVGDKPSDVGRVVLFLEALFGQMFIIEAKC